MMTIEKYYTEKQAGTLIIEGLIGDDKLYIYAVIFINFSACMVKMIFIKWKVDLYFKPYMLFQNPVQ